MFQRLTSSCIQPSSASLAFEMLRFLMVDQDLQIIKVTLTVVAPWPREDLFDVWVVALLFGHNGIAQRKRSFPKD